MLSRVLLLLQLLSTVLTNLNSDRSAAYIATQQEYTPNARYGFLPFRLYGSIWIPGPSMWPLPGLRLRFRNISVLNLEDELQCPHLILPFLPPWAGTTHRCTSIGHQWQPAFFYGFLQYHRQVFLPNLK